MRKLVHFLAYLLLTTGSLAQTLDKFHYQVVLRDTDNNLAINKNIELHISILQGSEFGIVRYRELHDTQSNPQGLVSVVIGEGTIEYGSLQAIDWSLNNYHLQSSCVLDGVNTAFQSSCPLTSVPYAFYAKDAALATGFRVLSDVPTSSVFIDSQIAVEVSLESTFLSSSHVQEALEALQESVETIGDMKTTVYDTEEDGTISNTSSINGLTVEAAVPSEAFFSDSQMASEVDLAKAIDIDGDNITTVESALIKLNDLLEDLWDQHDLAVAESEEIEDKEENRPCLATHYDETHDLLSFITGTERTLVTEEEVSNYCHYLYAESSYVSSSYKVIEDRSLRVTEDREQALSSSFLIETSIESESAEIDTPEIPILGTNAVETWADIEEGFMNTIEHTLEQISSSIEQNPDQVQNIEFSQPLLCRDSGTHHWGHIKTWGENELCVFGVSFKKDDGTYVLGRGESTDYELFMTEPSYTGSASKCAQVNVEPRSIFLEGFYDHQVGTCKMITLNNSHQDLTENFFVYRDSPIENFIYEKIGTMYLDQYVYDQFRSSPNNQLIDKFVYTQGVNVVIESESSSYRSMEYLRDVQCLSTENFYITNDCSEVASSSFTFLNDLQMLSTTKNESISTDNTSFLAVDEILDNKIALKLSPYSLASNATLKEQMETYINDLKETFDQSKTILDLYLGRLLENQNIDINLKAIVIKDLRNGEYNPDILESGVGTGSVLETITVESFEFTEVGLSLAAELELFPVFVNSTSQAQERQIEEHLIELVDVEIETLEQYSYNANFLPKIINVEPYMYVKDDKSNSFSIPNIDYGNNGIDPNQNDSNIEAEQYVLGVNLESLMSFVRYILRNTLGDFPDDISRLSTLIVTGLNLPVNNRGAFPESISLEDLTDLLVNIRALNGRQNEINFLSSYISDQGFEDINPDWDITGEQATAFISMLAGAVQLDNLNIQVFESLRNTNILHAPQPEHVFGLGNGENYQRVGAYNRLFISYGNGNEGSMYLYNSNVGSIHGQWNNGLIIENQNYTIISNQEIYEGQLEVFDVQHLVLVYPNSNEGVIFYYGLELIMGRYEGAIENSNANGQGEVFDDNNIRRNAGVFEDGLMTNGIVYNDDGRKSYEGDLLNGRINGLGTFYVYHHSGRREYRGNWIDETITGNGTCTRYNNEDKVIRVYTGDFVNRRRSGYGVYIFYDSNGKMIKKYEGNFINGSRCGLGRVIYYQNDIIKSVYEGNFERTKRSGHGQLTEYLPDDTIISKYEGEWHKGRKNGEGSVIIYHKNGHLNTIAEGKWVKNYLVKGTIQTFDSNGICVSTDIIDGPEENQDEDEQIQIDQIPIIQESP